ncbi:MAG TPA: hypothetical protein VGM89_09005 [Puia sp.]
MQLISRMISKAKDEFIETGVSALMWGAIISICSLVALGKDLFFPELRWLDAIWWLTFLGVIPQIVIAQRERKLRKYKGHDDQLRGGVWISFGVSIILMNYFVLRYDFPQPISVYLILYGIPTFTIGFGKRFRPMIIGGIACWVFAILSSMTPGPWQLLYLAGGAQVAWFIPGLILRKRYLKVKTNNV